jgi:hypothetical protein
MFDLFRKSAAAAPPPPPPALTTRAVQREKCPPGTKVVMAQGTEKCISGEGKGEYAIFQTETCHPAYTPIQHHGTKYCLSRNSDSYEAGNYDNCESGFEENTNLTTTNSRNKICKRKPTSGGRRTRHKKRKVRKGKSRKYRRY